MFNHSLLWNYCIAMQIMFCSSHCDIRFCLSHDIVKLWSSNYDEGFLFVTSWCWNRFVIVQQWVIFVPLSCWEMFVSLKYWSMFLTLPHSVVYITLWQWVVLVPLQHLEISIRI
jgi:hypothetical protein